MYMYGGKSLTSVVYATIYGRHLYSGAIKKYSTLLIVFCECPWYLIYFYSHTVFTVKLEISHIQIADPNLHFTGVENEEK